MSAWSEMLQSARLAGRLLGGSTELVGRFLLTQEAAGGGFKDRSGNLDLYYTAFGLGALSALAHGPAGSGSLAASDSAFLQTTAAFLEGFGSGDGLDLVHLCALARCWVVLAQSKIAAPNSERSQAVLSRIESFRSAEGGYHLRKNNSCGSAYGAFLACTAYDDWGCKIPRPERVIDSLRRLESPDGAWSNEPLEGFLGAAGGSGSTNATAGAVAVLRQLNARVKSSAGEWLLARVHPAGGFTANPTAPIPDLLSTATALHSLAGLGVPFDHQRQRCLDFVDSLWTRDGSFYGHWAETHLDCEYTFYGLVALGYLAQGN